MNSSKCHSSRFAPWLCFWAQFSATFSHELFRNFSRCDASPSRTLDYSFPDEYCLRSSSPYRVMTDRRCEVPWLFKFAVQFTTKAQLRVKLVTPRHHPLSFVELVKSIHRCVLISQLLKSSSWHASRCPRITTQARVNFLTTAAGALANSLTKIICRSVVSSHVNFQSTFKCITRAQIPYIRILMPFVVCKICTCAQLNCSNIFRRHYHNALLYVPIFTTYGEINCVITYSAITHMQY